MWALRVCWLLLGTLSVGSAQLLFEKYPAVEIDPCNTSTVILPCNVTNLNQHDASLMFVTWKYQDKVFFSFDGVDGNFVKNSTFQTANFLDRSRLHNGIATLVISIKEALPGNYSCEVVESNREGKTTIELIYSAVRNFVSDGHSPIKNHPPFISRKLLASSTFSHKMYH